jgi:hypothetical protein
VYTEHKSQAYAPAAVARPAAVTASTAKSALVKILIFPFSLYIHCTRGGGNPKMQVVEKRPTCEHSLAKNWRVNKKPAASFWHGAG